MATKAAIVAFIGHGSPMNVLANNAYTRDLRSWARGLKTPEAIIVISAHWQTQGTLVSCQQHPRQIYDFYGFPEELYQVAYPCPGAPELGKRISVLLSSQGACCSADWGIDHAAWAVLVQLFPHAGIPVIEISLDMTQPPAYHYAAGQALRPLKSENYLILGSGNMVHNLGEINWEEDAPHAPWAEDMANLFRGLISRRRHQALIDFPGSGTKANRGIPTLDHYLPLLHILGLQEDESPVFFHQGMQNSSISMDSFWLKP